MKKLFLLFCLTLISIFATAAMAKDYFIDVRSTQEYEEDHIPNHLHIVHTDIIAGVKNNKISTDDHIFLYCRSGKRASVARESLNNAGYNNVDNLGGINDARRFLSTYKEP